MQLCERIVEGTEQRMPSPRCRAPTFCSTGAALLLVLGGGPAGVAAQLNDPPKETYPLTHRSAETKSLNLMLDYDKLIDKPDAYESPAPAGSLRAAQDVAPPPLDESQREDKSKRVDWSQRVGKNWELDPVALERRQAGRPAHEDDDLASDNLLGVELRRRF